MEVIGSMLREPGSLRDAAKGLVRDARSIGSELTKPARLRMDAYQTERRLKNAYSMLGEVVYQELSALRNVDLNDGRLIELIAHIRYYHDELARLHTEISSGSDAA
jgi:hypothetical protein